MHKFVLPVLFTALVAFARTSDAQQVTNVSGDWLYVAEEWFPFSPVIVASLRGYTGTASNVVVPSTLGGYPVVRMVRYDGRTDFFGSATGTIRSVSLPNSITLWSPDIFYGCPNLTNVSVSLTNNSLRTVDGVLYSKQGDRLILYPPGLPGPFNIPETVNEISAHAFRRVNRLDSINIPDTVVRIGDSAFAESSSLKDIRVGNGVTDIGNGAFTYSSALATLTIGSSVTYGLYFYFNNALSSINVSPSNSTYSSLDGVLFNKLTNTLLAYPNSKGASYTVPTGVTTIGNGAFSTCSNLRSITIPTTVNTIGSAAFQYCTSLTNITLPDNVTLMGSYAFADCTALEQFTFSKGITVVPEAAFRRASKLRTITLSDTVREIQGSAFWECSGLTNVIIGSGVNTLGGAAFAHCSNLITAIFRGNAPVAALQPFTNTPATIYYLSGSTGWGPTYAGRPTAMIPVTANIIIEDSDGLSVADNATAFTFGSVLEGTTSEARRYTVRNSGGGMLTNLSITPTGGTNSGFIVTPPTATVVEPISSTPFTVTFQPTKGGNYSSSLIINSSASNYSLFRINLAGFGIGTNLDTDSDGLNDAAEFTMRELGFDWQATQTALVGTLLNNAGRAGLYNEVQYQGNRLNGRNDILSNPAQYNLYTSSSIMDLRMNGLMVQKNGSNALVSFQPQTTTDLTLPFTNNGTPITYEIPMPGSKGFIRINAKPIATPTPPQ